MGEKEKEQVQNEPVRPPEAQEEANKAEAPSQGGAKVEAVQEPAGEATEAASEEVVESPRGRETIMLDEELVTPEPTMVAPGVAPVAEKQVMAEVAAPKLAKKSHKGLIITIIVTVVLAVGAVTVWWLTTKGKAEETVEDSNSTEVEKPEGETKPGEGNELMALDINSDVVQGVYNHFSSLTRGGNIIGDPFIVYTNDELELWQLVRFEPAQLETCKDPIMEALPTGELYMAGEPDSCHDADVIKKKIKYDFDRDFEWTELNNAGEVNYCGETYVASSNQIQLIYRCGGNGPYQPLVRALTRAEEDEYRLYLYEGVARYNPSLIIDEYWTGVTQPGYYQLVPSDKDAQSGLAGTSMADGDMLDIEPNLWMLDCDYKPSYDGAEYVCADVNEYAKKFSQFKWTFKKMGDGRYVFESVAPVEK